MSSAPFADAFREADVVAHFGRPPPDLGWVTHEMLQLREWLVASPAYLKARGRPASIADLATHDLLSWSVGGPAVTRWPTLDGLEFRVEPVLVLPDVHALRALAVQGLGVALVPEGEVPDPHIPDNALEPVLPDVVGRVTPLSVSVSPSRAGNARSRAVIEAARVFAERI